MIALPQVGVETLRKMRRLRVTYPHGFHRGSYGLGMIARLSSRLDGKPRSGVAVGYFRSPFELAVCADGAHDRDARWFEPVWVFAVEGGPVIGVLVARAAAFVAYQEHVSRHPRADLRWFVRPPQEAETDVAV